MRRPFSRRKFLASLGAGLAGGSAAQLGALAVPAVEAVPTVFHGHPDGTRTLVRFIVRNSEAPAGRLRVYAERTNTLLGTAGVLPVGNDRLRGELWLPLDQPLRIRTELEYPGTRQPLRDRFTLQPTPRWTLYWLLFADPTALAERLAGIDPLLRGVAASTLANAGVQLDPVRSADPLTDLDAARIAWPAAQAARRTGLPLAPLGTALRGFPALPAVMRASGLTGTAGMIDEPWTLVDALPGSLAALQRLVEEQLITDHPLHRGFVLVPAGTDAPDLAPIIEAWSSRFAYPALRIGTAPDDLRFRTVGIPHAPLPEGARGLARRRDRAQPLLREEHHALFAPLARRAGGGPDPLATIASAFRYPVAGRLVFNPTAFGRTDVVRVRDGERIATNVPGPGYALLPADPPLHWPAPEPAATTATIENATWRVRIDARGTIASLLHRPTNRDVAGPGGLLAVPDGRLVRAGLARVAGLGERLTLTCEAGGFSWDTTITLYDGVETVDVASDGGPWNFVWTFDVAGASRVRWAEPLGLGQAEGAFGPALAEAWVAMDGEQGSLLIATPDGALVGRDERGVVACTLPEGATRFRLGFVRLALPEDPWRVGAMGVPLDAREASGNGQIALPTFGRLVDIGDPGARLVGLKPAHDGQGIIVYLHDCMGATRPVAVRAGLLPFSAAFACDLLERDRVPLPVRDGAVHVDLPGGGVTAVRLVG